MSDPVQAASDAAEPEPASAKPAAAPPRTDAPAKPRRKRRWLRRIAYTFAILFVLAVGIRIAAWIALPTVLRQVGKTYDLDIKYDELSLTVLGADAELWHLSMAPKGVDKPLFDAEYCRADIVLWELFRGRLVVRRLEADGVDLDIERAPDGSFVGLEKFMDWKGPRYISAQRKPKPPPKPGEEPQIDLSSPVVLDALRLQHVDARFRDRTVTPPFETRMTLNMRLSNLGSETRPVRFGLAVTSAPVLDNLEVEGEGHARGQELSASMDVRMKGLHLRPLAAYLEPFGIRAAGESISFRSSATLKASAAAPPEEKSAVRAELVLEKIEAHSDGEEILALDRMSLTADSIGPRHARLGTLSIEAPRARARRVESGVRVAGLEIGGASPAGSTPAPVRPAPAPTPVPATPPAEPAPAPAGEVAAEPEIPPPPFRFSIAEVRAKGGGVWFRDDAVEPPAALSLELKEFSLENIVLDPSSPDAPIEIETTLGAPGLVSSIRVTGKAVPFAPKKTLELLFAAEGAQLSALAPYLALAGLEPDLENGKFGAKLDAEFSMEGGPLSAGLRFTDIAFSDKGELFGLARVEAKGLSFDPATGTTRLESFEVSGPAVSASRDDKGVVHLLGVRSRTGPAPRRKVIARAQPAEAPVADAPRDESAPPPPPAQASRRGDIHIGRLAWKDVKLRFRDAGIAPPAEVAIADGGFEIENVVIPAAATEPTRGSLRAWLAAPGLVEKLAVTGSISALPSSPSIEAVAKGEGVSWAALASYLKPHGIEAALENGAIGAKLRAGATLLPEGIDATVAIEEVALTGAAGESMGLGAFRMDGIRVRESDVRIGAIEVVAPRLDAGREEDGAIVLAGLRYRRVPPPAADAAPASEPAPATAAPGAAPVAAAPPAAPVTTPATPPAAAETPPSPPARPRAVTVERFLLEEAAITWWDRAVAPPVKTRTTSSAELRGLVLGRAADPAWFTASLASEGVLEKLTAVGAISLAPEAKTLLMNVEGNGFRAGPLASYFPPSVRMSLADGRVRGKFSTRLERHPEGGQRGGFTITEAMFQDGANGPALLAVGSAKLDIARADVAGRRIDIEEISAGGVELAVRREPAGGGISVLGITAGGKAAAPAPEAAPEVKHAPEPGGAPDAQPRAPTAIPSRLHAKPPLVTLGKLDLALDKLTVTDAGNPGAAPITLEARLASKKRIELLGDEPEARPPIELDLTGKLTPLVASFGAASRISPYAAEPSLEVDFQASGIRGEGLLEAFPALAEKIDGRELADGRVRGRIETTFQVKRRYPADIGFAAPFGMRFNVKGAEFRGGQEGPVLLGLQDLAMEAPRIDPKTGGVHVKSLELTKPAALVRRTKEGVHAAGFLVRMPQAAAEPEAGAEPAEKPEPAPPPEPQPEPKPASPQPAPTQPDTQRAEVRIDRIIVSGVDVLIEDTSAEPAFRMPLTDLDVEVHGITNRALTEPRPIRFSALLRSGKVELPKALKKGAILGAASDALALASGAEVEKAGGMEERSLFEEATTSGKLTLFPKPTGWVKAGLSSFELAALKGIAESKGMTLTGGLFDAGANVRFASDGSLDADTSLTFTDLDVTEPSDGPIFRYLSLPAPLGTVIFVLRDEDGALEIPVSFGVGAEGLSKAEVVRAALASMGTVIANAVAHAPLRMMGAVGSLVAGEEEEKPEEPVIVRFSGGDPSASGGEIARLEPLLERLRDGEELNLTLTHALGGADVARAGLRSSPSVTEIMDLARQIQFRRDELVRERETRAAEAKALYGLGMGREAAAAAERAAKLDRESGLLELSLDRLRDLIKPGAERQGVRRMREATLAIGRARLAGVRWALIDSGIPGIEERIRILPARFEEPQGDGGGTVSVLASVRKEP